MAFSGLNLERIGVVKIENKHALGSPGVYADRSRRIRTIPYIKHHCNIKYQVSSTNNRNVMFDSKLPRINQLLSGEIN